MADNDGSEFQALAEKLMAEGKAYGYGTMGPVPMLSVDPDFDVRDLPVTLDGSIYVIVRLPEPEAL